MTLVVRLDRIYSERKAEMLAQYEENKAHLPLDIRRQMAEGVAESRIRIIAETALSYLSEEDITRVLKPFEQVGQEVAGSGDARLELVS